MALKEKQPETDKNRVKIIIVDDHPIVRQGLINLIQEEKDLEVCGQAEDAQQAMRSIEALKPDLAIVDISLKETNGLELIKDIRRRFPDLLVLVLSMHDESVYAERALRAGAMGYVMKQVGTEHVISAIRKILDDKIYLSEVMTARFMRGLVNGKSMLGTSSIKRLSNRELEILHLIGQRCGNRQMAENLHLSIKTIETYKERIKKKLLLGNAIELLHYAFQWINNQEKND